MPSTTEQLDHDHRCDCCAGAPLEILYVVPDSVNGSRVELCPCCGLLQSVATVTHHRRERRVVVSSGADWGNIRYGKGFRTAEALRLIAALRPIAQFQICLDIGANRGDFLQQLLKQNQDILAVAVEPDEAVTDDYRDDARIRLLTCRFEDAGLTGEFDLIYCCHTLEHLGSPTSFLAEVHTLLAENGILYLEVPDLEVITAGDVVEEFFIDKHTFHFTAASLERYLANNGFTVLHHVVSGSNLVYLLGRGAAFAQPQAARADVAEVSRVRDAVALYRRNMTRNMRTLQDIGTYINSRNIRTVFWGAGRIFDSLMRAGTVDRQIIAGVIDKYLPDHVESVHGFQLARPAALADFRPELIVIASREYATEIRADIARYYAGTAEVLVFPELMAQFSVAD